jgi:geranylgeranyl diphosphate synthase type I
MRPTATQYGLSGIGDLGAGATVTTGSGASDALLGAAATGGDPAAAVPVAVAVELVHNFSLLHDDVMDGDRERRHRPTAWTVFGVPAALLAGDAMLALAVEVLAETPSPTSDWAVRCVSAATRRLIAGQAADVAFETRSEVGLDECLQMAADKTAALLECSASLGAVLVDAPSTLALGLAQFGGHLGMAFQLTDDLLGIWGAPEVTGKAVGSDLRSRKKSLPVVAAMTAGTAESAQLVRLYAAPGTLSDEQVGRAAELVEAAGGRAWAEARSERELDDALTVIASLAVDPGLEEDVRTDLDHLTNRLRGREQ